MKKYGNISLKKLTSYKLDGITKQLIYPETIDELKEIIKDIREDGMKYKVIGGGSNLIFDGNYNGVLIKLDYFDNVEFDGTNNWYLKNMDFFLHPESLHLSNTDKNKEK